MVRRDSGSLTETYSVLESLVKVLSLILNYGILSGFVEMLQLLPPTGQTVSRSPWTSHRTHCPSTVLDGLLLVHGLVRHFGSSSQRNLHVRGTSSTTFIGHFIFNTGLHWVCLCSGVFLKRSVYVFFGAYSYKQHCNKYYRLIFFMKSHQTFLFVTK